MTPTELQTKWNDGHDELVAVPETALSDLKLTADCKAFLIEAGLPQEAAPFLSFDAAGSGRLESVADAYGLGPELRKYIMIGSDGAGNPICLDLADSAAIVCLDHEAGFLPIRMNRSVSQLAEVLLAYRQMVRDTSTRNGDDAFLDGNIPRDLRDRLEADLRQIDSECLQTDRFWANELQTIDANREQWEADSKAGK